MRPLFLLVSILILALAGRAAAEPGDAGGRWVWTVEGRPVLILDIGDHPTLTRPGSMTFTASGGLQGVSGPVRTVSLTAEPVGGDLRLIGEGRGYRVHLLDDNRLQLHFEDGPNAGPLMLHRPHAPDQVQTDWGGDRVYGQGGRSEPADPTLKALFDADQTARSGGPDIDWTLVMEQDRERRLQTRALLDQGAVRSGDDFYHAAFIFQHGETSDDYLLAHALAVTAVAKGRPDASWIAAATLDRYLQNIGQPQIYGTQFQIPDEGPVTQGDYNRELVPDVARTAAGVPDLARQDEQRAAYEARRPT
jgi:hypothetical protein